jgi:heat-inducible transcriptional repressor
MDLSDRKSKILKAIIEDYISTAEPIGSRTISKRIDLKLSSATIRNEMADLEEMGYLVQPHTSAGRIPSDLGYRFYVNELLKKYSFNVNQLEQIRKAFSVKLLQLDSIVREAGNLLARSSGRYISLVTMPQSESLFIRRMGLMYMDAHTFLAILVKSDAMVHNKVIYTQIAVTEEIVNILSQVLNTKLAGLHLDEITPEILTEIGVYLGDAAPILIPVMEFLKEVLAPEDGAPVYYSGTTNILSQPEYTDVHKAKELIDFLESNQDIQKLIPDRSAKNENISVSIGKENKAKALEDCSTITITYKAGKNATGKIGIIGPTRMDYAGVLQSLEGISLHINTLLEQLYHMDGSEEVVKNKPKKRPVRRLE